MSSEHFVIKNIMSARIHLIWFDVKEKQIDGTMKIQSTFTFDNQQKCVDYVQSISKTETIFLIVSIPSATEMLSVIHNLRQLDSIFLFSSSDSEEQDEDLIEKYSKIIDIFSHYDQLFESINENIELATQQNESFQFYEQRQKSTRELSKEAPLFFWLRLFKDVILQLPHNDQAKQEMIDKLKEHYRNNNKQLKWIDKFSREYQSNDAIRWYTGEPFIYKQLNRALRTEDIELLYLFRYFISDLSKQLLQEFQDIRHSFSSIIYFYRGTILSKEEVEKLKMNVGRLISTNGYLSTSLSKEVALSYTDSSKTGQEQSVLFEIEYDFGKIDSIIIALVSPYSQHPFEQEVLFDLDAAFYLSSVTLDTSLNLVHVKMSVSDEGVAIAQDHLSEIDTDIRNSSATIVFGRLLVHIGQYEKSQRYFDRLINNPGNEDVSSIYYHMGAAQCFQGRYEQALDYYRTAYAMMMNSSTPRPFPSSFVLNDIGVIYKIQGQYDLALDYLQRALEIRKNSPHHLVTATSLENIALIYFVKGDYDRALALQETCLQIRETYLAKEHRYIGKTLGNIGGILLEKDQLNAALEYYQRSQKIIEKSLPAEHEDFAACLNRIALVLTSQGQYNEALNIYQRVLKIREKNFPHGHLNITAALGGIGYIYCLLKNYNRALEYLQKALNLRETLFTDINDTGLVYILSNLGLVFLRIHQYDSNLFYNERALQVARVIFPVGHPKLTDCLISVGISFREIKDYPNAMEYFERASRNTEENTNQPNQIGLARIYDNMGVCIFNQGDEDTGLKYRIKAVRILASLSPRLLYCACIDQIGDICFIKDELDLALECYFTSLGIRTECHLDDPLELTASFINIADTYVAMKKTCYNTAAKQCSIKARRYYEMALNVYQELQHSTVVDILYKLGSMYEYMKQYRRALDYYQQGLKSCEKNISSEIVDAETFEECISRVRWLID